MGAQNTTVICQMLILLLELSKRVTAGHVAICVQVMPFSTIKTLVQIFMTRVFQK